MLLMSVEAAVPTQRAPGKPAPSLDSSVKTRSHRTLERRQMLSEHHSAMLQASAISDDVIAQRGYFTATRKVQLGDLGFATSQQLVPALVIPVFAPHGEVMLYQIRPDQPRMRQGKIVKYETPAGARMTLDVPPRARNLLGDPGVPLFVTEGVKKGDALATPAYALSPCSVSGTSAGRMNTAARWPCRVGVHRPQRAPGVRGLRQRRHAEGSRRRGADAAW